MAKIRSEELDWLAGEVLPERTVLSVIPYGGGADGGTVMQPSTCQQLQPAGVLTTLLGTQNTQCAGTAIATGH